MEEVLDWWLKFYVLVGDEEKCGEYFDKGYLIMKVGYKIWFY